MSSKEKGTFVEYLMNFLVTKDLLSVDYPRQIGLETLHLSDDSVGCRIGDHGISATRTNHLTRGIVRQRTIVKSGSECQTRRISV